ncbi:hypothetical protein C4D60_Mb04t30830 [Musa balbisiana]|uniref:Ribosomal RNA-processing protein 42 n=1 Tax=Musa balbisiana TaxID=52838 RepID=A0A4S8KFZ9_MUSBA|nr:hypothetical protein C4D60_Mb04t30830 [Musa balbisiana]
MGRRIPWWRRWSAREASGPVEQRAALNFLEWHRGDPTVERLKSSGKDKASQTPACSPARKPSSFFPFLLLPAAPSLVSAALPQRSVHFPRTDEASPPLSHPLVPGCSAICRSDVFATACCSTAASKRPLWFGFFFATVGLGTAAYCSSPPSRLRISLSHRRALVGSATGKRMVGLSEGEKRFIQGGIAQDLRTDGRQRLHYRPISVETGVIPQANGSARVRLGATDVIVSIKGRGGEELSTELSFALQRCLLGGRSGAGAGIDLSSLVIVEGKVCWDLYIDGLVVSSDGNLLDALAAAIKVALSNTGIPKVTVNLGASPNDQPDVDVSDEEFLQFDTSGVPVVVTLTKVSRHYIVDATSEEESQMSSAVSISVNRHGHICGLTKRGGAGLDPSVILDMISVAKHVGEQLMSLLDSEIAAAEASAEDQ